MTPSLSVPCPDTWQSALQHSRYLRHLLEARPHLMPWIEEHVHHPLDAPLMHQFLASAESTDDDSLKAALRALRQRVMATLIVRDLSDVAPLAEVMSTMTDLANVSTNHALDFIHHQLICRHGEPLDSSGQAQRLMVIGMGKLGGGELNVSSDVDYIFVYPEEGETAGNEEGRGKIDNYDFFTRLGKRLISALGEPTADGQVFRVDMRLRPHGDSGPLVCSLDSLEHYLIAQGREWERYAWIKARVMNEGDNLQAAWPLALEKIARPFVFRKYLDYGAINAMRDLHTQIRREVTRKDMANHIKLGPGGIREIEFIAQVFQLIRGGRDPALQIRPTLAVLDLLAERQQIPDSTRDELTRAYEFFRRLEHRLQYVDDAQTHTLPEDSEARTRLAISMGYTDWESLAPIIDGHRKRVSHHFDQVFSEPESGTHPLLDLWLGQCESEEACQQLGTLGFRHPAETLEHLSRLRGSSRYQQLPAVHRERFDAVGPRLIQAAAGTPNPDITLERALGFVESISRRGAYLAFLQQYPQALSKVAELVGAATWAADYLKRHPILLDELLDPRLYDIATDWNSFRQTLAKTLAAHKDDAEREMDLLREAHHAQVFRLLAQDLGGLQTVERLSDHLSELADIMVQTTLDLVWPKIRQAHRETPAFAVIGYGRLGGKELGYASDLDIVFIYDDEAPEAQENYTRLAQRLTTWLSSQTSAGQLFETDLRLRPNGEAGLLACSVEAFREYQLQHAWIWEHQALTRARFVAGDPALGERFEAIRHEILTQQRDLTKLRDEVLAMRQRMFDAHASSHGETFDLKQDRGGLIDVEFIVQYLILAHAHRHPELTRNLGNIALLGMAADLGLISRERAERVREAYRQYRRLQHAERLNGQHQARRERTTISGHINAVTALWQEVLGA